MLAMCKFIHDSQQDRTIVRLGATVGRICITSPTTVSTAFTGGIPGMETCGRRFTQDEVNP